jgi:hypothetical protein
MKQLPPPPIDYQKSHKVIGKWMHKHQLSCQHFTELSLMATDRPLTFRERIRCLTHFFACSICRKFNRQIKVMRHLVKLHVTDLTKTTPSDEFLFKLRENLSKQNISDTKPPESELK